MILLPWNRQPIGRPRLDPSNPITRGIIDCSVGAQSINLASGLRLEPNGGAVIHIATSPQGLARATDGTNNFFATSAAPAGLNINEVTLMVLTTPRSVSTATRSMYGFGNTGSATPLLFVGQAASANALYLFARDDGGTTQNPEASVPSGTWADNQPVVIVAARSVGRNVHELYVNGIQAATTTATTLSTTSLNSTAVGGLRRNTDGLGYWGSTALAVTWSRCLSPAEILRVSQYPWQIFAPQIIWIDSPASGGTDYPESLTETASATETIASVLGFASAQTDTGSATESAVSVAALSAAITEVGSASDTASGSAAGDYLATITETSTATDVASAVAAFLAAISESASATDTASASSPGNYTAVMVEAATASDVLSGSFSALATIVEMANATDSINFVGAMTYTRAPRGAGYPGAKPGTERYGSTGTSRSATTNTRR